MRSMNNSVVSQFCQQIGAEEVWRSWRVNMLVQDREVPPDRMQWETLPERDKILDAAIAENVIMHFLSFLTVEKIDQASADPRLAVDPEIDEE